MTKKVRHPNRKKKKKKKDWKEKFTLLLSRHHGRKLQFKERNDVSVASKRRKRRKMELVRKGAAKTNQDFFLPREKERKFHEHILSLASPSTLFFYTSSYSPLNSSNSNSFFFIVHCSFLILNQVGKTVRGEPIDARNFRLPQLLHHHFSSSFILLSHNTDRVG